MTTTRRLVSVLNGSVMGSWDSTVALPQGGGAIAWFCLDGADPTLGCSITSQVCRRQGRGGAACLEDPPLARPPQVLAEAGCAEDGSDCILDVNVTDGREGSSSFSAHTQFLGPPAAVLARLPAPQPLLVATVGDATPSGSLPITIAFAGDAPVSSAGLPLCTTLTSTFAGSFDRNAFTPLALPFEVAFIPWGESPDPQAFAETLRVQHLGQYVPASAA